MRPSLTSGRSALLLAAPALLIASPAFGQQDPQPMLGSPLRGLTSAELDLFYLGLDAFNTAITPEEGLGPVFNEPACGSCHNHPASGGSSVRLVTRFSIGGTDLMENLGGPLLQDQSLDPDNCGEVIPPTADHIIQRVTPICFGAGLLEAIVDSDIVANESNGGFANLVADLSDGSAPLRPARFGWKGGLANVISFSIDAALMEMGLTNIFLPVENLPNNDPNKAFCDGVGDPEDQPDALGRTKVDRFTDFQRLLAAPPQTPRSGMTGEALFARVGCATCHTPGYVTGTAPEAAIANQAIQPYSDFLLHDMGALNDGILEGNAGQNQMQTRALWGLSVRQSFLHDGRVTGGTFFDNMSNVIQEHDGEGSASRAAFNALTAPEKQQLVDFLQSLGRVEFDYERDNDLDDFDWFFIEPFLTGPGTFFDADAPEAFCDIEQDGDFDLHDVASLQIAYTGQSPDIPSTQPVLEPQSALDLHVLSGGSKNVSVAPGGEIHYEIRGELDTAGPQGLAMFSMDLSFTGGPLGPLDEPEVLTSFTGPLGLANPAGFGGTRSGGDLLQVGGAQNSIAAAFSTDYFKGDLVLDVATRGNRAVLARGKLTAPATPGVYTVDISNVVATAVIEQAQAGDDFWRVAPVATGKLTSLNVKVVQDAPSVYCTGKTSSQGCVPILSWRGLPTLNNGGDNFVLRLENAVPDSFSLVVWGGAPDNQPFQGGTLCVGGGLNRTVPSKTQGDADCSGLYKFKFSQSYMAQAGLTGGATVFAQGWFRDLDQADGTKTGLSDAVSFTILP